MELPTSQQAVQQDEQNALKVVQNVPVRSPAPGYVLVRTAAVALQPADLNLFSNFPLPGALGGIDFSGTVVRVGSDVDANMVQVGDQVGAAAFAFSAEHRLVNGAFSEYVQVPPHLLLRSPRSPSPACKSATTDQDSDLASALAPQSPSPSATNAHDENTSRLGLVELATLSTAIATCILSFWRPDSLQLEGTPAKPLASPEEPSMPVPVLVYGGSTSVGTIAIQLLRLSGYAPITTCSPSNFALVRARGAVAAFDYSDEAVADKISAAAHGRLKYAMDCIGRASTVDICYRAIQRPGGRYVTLQHVPDTLLAKRRAVVPLFVLAAEARGEVIELGSQAYDRPASPAIARLTADHTQMIQREVLDRGRLVPHPVEIMPGGGLEAVLRGLDLLAANKVSGKKLVVVLDDGQLDLSPIKFPQ